MIDFLQQDPMGFLQFMLYRAPAILIALTFHEVAHGYVALKCGDPTAKLMNRLSLNPIKHLDPIGTVSMFLLGFGWAKPVPVNPNNFRRGSRDDLFVSLAGVTTNMIFFIISTFLTVLLGFILYVPDLIRQPGGMDLMLNFSQNGFVMQLFPQYAREISSLIRVPWLLHLQRFMLHFSMINLGLCLFNLLPIPPLDGFHVFNDLLLKGKLNLSGKGFRIAQVALIVLMFSTNIVGRVISVAVNFVQQFVLHGFLAVFGL
ncbi:MAG: site-2 protease family protein [Clostridiales bacterium]|nr:site-2 protease family protein [Clostridiales bacterium]